MAGVMATMEAVTMVMVAAMARVRMEVAGVALRSARLKITSSCFVSVFGI